MTAFWILCVIVFVTCTVIGYSACARSSRISRDRGEE
jgi:hypothetical protein